jgi:hypothetical protein
MFDQFLPNPTGRAVPPCPIRDSHGAFGQLYWANQGYHSLHHLCLGPCCLSEDTKAGVVVWNIVGQKDVIDIGPSNFAHLDGPSLAHEPRGSP